MAGRKDLSNVRIVDNTETFLREMVDAKTRALERIGFQAEGYARDLAPPKSADEDYTGIFELRNSITHKVIGDDVYIGTNQEYAVYVELGTGKYYPGGRPTPWKYKDDEGQWHYTAGQRAQPYLKPAAADHMQTYRNIIKDELGDGYDLHAELYYKNTKIETIK